MWIFGTRWVRSDVTTGWGGPCSTGSCGVDVFWSTDLKTWKNASATNFPQGIRCCDDVIFTKDILNRNDGFQY